MCGTCYQRWWQEQNPGRTKARRAAAERPSACHPDKAELARGLCANCYRRQWRLENPGKDWDRNAARQRRKYAASEGYRRQQILRRYGITPEQYDDMLAAQGGVCAVCLTRPNEGRPLQVDHCHESERIRALLCHRCNSTLGHAQDDIARLEGLIRYLKEHA